MGAYVWEPAAGFPLAVATVGALIQLSCRILQGLVLAKAVGSQLPARLPAYLLAKKPPPQSLPHPTACLPTIFVQASCVVMDELHMVADTDRGIVLNSDMHIGGTRPCPKCRRAVLCCSG